MRGGDENAGVSRERVESEWGIWLSELSELHFFFFRLIFGVSCLISRLVWFPLTCVIMIRLLHVLTVVALGEGGCEGGCEGGWM